MIGSESLPFFSVVIPTYNRGALIAATLDSVFAQEYRDFEVIVVDDGSTDDTADRLRPYLDRIRFVTQANKGPGAARNLGANSSIGEYIAFLDSDDLWFPWTLGSYAEIIREENSPALLAGKLLYFSHEDELSLIRKTSREYCYFPDYFASSSRGLYCGAGQMLAKKSSFLAAGGFVETKINAEDHDLAMRCGTFGGFVFISSPNMIAYRQHPQAVTMNTDKTYAGIMYMLSMEKSGKYPGGSERRRDRWRILTQHVRPLSLELMKQGDTEKAWTLYRKTLIWNLAAGRIRYVAGFPGKALLSLCKLS